MSGREICERKTTWLVNVQDCKVNMNRQLSSPAISPTILGLAIGCHPRHC